MDQNPVPGPESNGLSSSVMDTVADGSSTVWVVCRRRIQWTSALDASLLRLNDQRARSEHHGTT